VLLASIGALIGYGANIAIAFYLMGINPITAFFTGLDQALPQMVNAMTSAGMSGQSAIQWQGEFQQSIEMMKIILPGALLLYAPIISFINYVAASRIIMRLGQFIEGLSGFFTLEHAEGGGAHLFPGFFCHQLSAQRRFERQFGILRFAPICGPLPACCLSSRRSRLSTGLYG
jgi:hypothetical protein